MDSNILTRIQLYKLVWSQPLKQLAEPYGVSVSFLSKLCHRHNIPLPSRGYWSKLKFNKPVISIELPNPEFYEAEIKIQHPQCTAKLRIEDSPFIQFEGVRLDKKLLVVPDTLRNPLPSIAKMKKIMEKEKPSEGWLTSKMSIVDVKVSPKGLNRTLRILNTLLKLFEILNYEVINSWRSKLQHQDISFEFNVREPRTRSYEKDKYGWNQAQFTPAGVLSITFGSYPKREFKDTGIPLEKKIYKIIDYLIKRFKKEKQEKLEREERWRIQEEGKRKIQEAKQRIKAEFQKFLILRNRAFLWQESQSIHSYIAAMEIYSDHSANQQEYIDWAKQKANWLNPLKETEDELLNHNHKAELLKFIYKIE